MATTTSQENNHEEGALVAQEGHGELHHSHTLYAEKVTTIAGLPITTALITSWLSVLVIIILSFALRLSLKKIPGKLQHLFEMMIEGGLSMADQVTGSRRISEKVLPIALAIFMFVLVNNWFGILPLTAIGFVQNHSFIPFIRSGTADINTTIGLAVVAVLAANAFGVVSLGAWKMFNKYVNVKALGIAVRNVRKDPMGLLTAPIHFFVGIIEIVGEFAKIASLSFRLFGNVFAGEVLLASMAALVAYAVPIPFLFLEVMVGAVQAFIFAMLTIVYFTIASTDHDHDESH